MFSQLVRQCHSTLDVLLSRCVFCCLQLCRRVFCCLQEHYEVSGTKGVFSTPGYEGSAKARDGRIKSICHEAVKHFSTFFQQLEIVILKGQFYSFYIKLSESNISKDQCYSPFTKHYKGVSRINKWSVELERRT